MTDDAKRLLKLINRAIDSLYISLINNGAVERLTKALESVENGKTIDKNVTFARITKSMLSEINVIRELQGKTLLTKRNITAFSGAINEHLGEHIKNYGSARNVALSNTESGKTSLKSISPRSNKQIKNSLLRRESLLDGDLVGGNDPYIDTE